MTLAEFVKLTATNAHALVRPKIVCRDGFSISVQGSTIHYSNPQKNTDRYTAMEVRWPSDITPELAQYAEEPNDLERTIYLYVPVELIQQLIDKHGGIHEGKSFPY